MKKILIIDDELDICLLLKRYLSKKGFAVEHAQDAKIGLEAVQGFKPDLVLSDFRMGDLDGREILQKIKGNHPDLPVIIMTGYSDIKIAVDVMKLGAFDYLTKPLFPDEILLTVQRALSANVDAADHDNVGEAKGTSTPKDEKLQKRRTNKQASKDYIFGNSTISANLVKQISLVAPTNYSVIIFGESGAGKEAVAHEIHKKSTRADKPFVAMDCGAIPGQLAGSELFGHEKGAFTGALEQKIGHFELANGGTLFLDEVANLSYEVQVSLLRTVQERKIRRVGGTKEIPIDVRIIVASNERLLEASQRGSFREDLYHRFNEFSIDVPPLRAREEDIMLFAHYFLALCNEDLNKSIKGFAPEVENLFNTYPWHGNLREMLNVMKRATLLSEGDTIELRYLPFEVVNYKRMLFAEKEPQVVKGALMKSDIPAEAYNPFRQASTKDVDLKTIAQEAEVEAILEALRQTRYNKSKAAEILNIDRKTLYNKLKAYNI